MTSSEASNLAAVLVREAQLRGDTQGLIPLPEHPGYACLYAPATEMSRLHAELSAAGIEVRATGGAGFGPVITMLVKSRDVAALERIVRGKPQGE